MIDDRGTSPGTRMIDDRGETSPDFGEVGSELAEGETSVPRGRASGREPGASPERWASRPGVDDENDGPPPRAELPSSPGAGGSDVAWVFRARLGDLSDSKAGKAIRDAVAAQAVDQFAGTPATADELRAIGLATEGAVRLAAAHPPGAAELTIHVLRSGVAQVNVLHSNGKATGTLLTNPSVDVAAANLAAKRTAAAMAAPLPPPDPESPAERERLLRARAALGPAARPDMPGSKRR
jgi:hypothetical protein